MELEESLLIKNQLSELRNGTKSTKDNVKSQNEELRDLKVKMIIYYYIYYSNHSNNLSRMALIVILL